MGREGLDGDVEDQTAQAETDQKGRMEASPADPTPTGPRVVAVEGVDQMMQVDVDISQIEDATPMAQKPTRAVSQTVYITLPSEDDLMRMDDDMSLAAAYQERARLQSSLVITEDGRVERRRIQGWHMGGVE